MTDIEKIKKFITKKHSINCALTDEIIEFIEKVESESKIAVAKPLLADVRAIADKYGRWERVRKGVKVVPHIVISKRSFDKMLRELSEHFR